MYHAGKDSGDAWTYKASKKLLKLAKVKVRAPDEENACICGFRLVCVRYPFNVKLSGSDTSTPSHIYIYIC